MMGLQADSQFRYSNLLAAHIKLAMFSEGGETSALRDLRPDYEADMEGYFAQLPAIIEDGGAVVRAKQSRARAG
jgi:hypothetical protein